MEDLPPPESRNSRKVDSPDAAVNWVVCRSLDFVAGVADVDVCDRHAENDDGIHRPIPEETAAGRRDSLAAKSRYPPSYRHWYPSIRGHCPEHCFCQNHPWRYLTAAIRTKMIVAVRVPAFQEVVGGSLHGTDAVEIVVRPEVKAVVKGRPVVPVVDTAEAVSCNLVAASEWLTA